MAQRLDSFQKAELVDFLDGLYRLGGYRTQRQWADESGYGTVAMSNALNRNNTDGVGGYTLLKLIRAAAARAEITPTEAARRASTTAGESRSSPDPLEELVARVAELGRGQARIALELGIQLGSDAPAAVPEKPRRARPKPKRVSR